MNREQQIKNWSIHYNRPISLEEYEQICQNLAGFFSVLKEWADKEGNQGADGEH